jgi:hypothetical protein
MTVGIAAAGAVEVPVDAAAARYIDAPFLLHALDRVEGAQANRQAGEPPAPVAEASWLVELVGRMGVPDTVECTVVEERLGQLVRMAAETPGEAASVVVVAVQGVTEEGQAVDRLAMGRLAAAGTASRTVESAIEVFAAGTMGQAEWALDGIAVVAEQ